MSKAKWWVCGDCHSLNDLPANKCYKCRGPKPADARLIDDQYTDVRSEKRVGITVDLSQVGDLTRPDPLETSKPGGIIEAFTPAGLGDAAQANAPERELYDPYGREPEPAPTPVSPPGGTALRPMRDPVRRGIEALGAKRPWTIGADGSTATASDGVVARSPSPSTLGSGPASPSQSAFPPPPPPGNPASPPAGAAPAPPPASGPPQAGGAPRAASPSPPAGYGPPPGYGRPPGAPMPPRPPMPPGFATGPGVPPPSAGMPGPPPIAPAGGPPQGRPAPPPPRQEPPPED